MIVIIPLGGRVRHSIRSSHIETKKTDEKHFDLTGDALNLTGITADQVFILPDSATVEMDQELTEELIAQALPLEQFITVSAEESMIELLGLLLRSAVSDGRITDKELLKVQPILNGRIWQPGLVVEIGDVYSFGGILWRCIQSHTTQGDWAPDMTPALWHRVEIISDDTNRMWGAGIAYVVGDEVLYEDTIYICLQAHTSQEGWEPAGNAALWRKTTVE